MVAALCSVGRDQLWVDVTLWHPRVAVCIEPLDSELAKTAVASLYKPEDKRVTNADEKQPFLAVTNLSSINRSTAQYVSCIAALLSDAERTFLRFP